MTSRRANSHIRKQVENVAFQLCLFFRNWEIFIGFPDDGGQILNIFRDSLAKGSDKNESQRICKLKLKNRECRPLLKINVECEYLIYIISFRWSRGTLRFLMESFGSSLFLITRSVHLSKNYLEFELFHFDIIEGMPIPHTTYEAARRPFEQTS